MNSETLIIAPYSQRLPNGKRNPKEYPYWVELIELLKARGWKLIQISVAGDVPLVEDVRVGLRLKAIEQLLHDTTTWISIDSFLPHLAVLAQEPGIVLWGKSDPAIFGHPTNFNMLKDRAYLRKRQSGLWTEEEYDENVFVKPEAVVKQLESVWPLLQDTPETSS